MEQSKRALWFLIGLSVMGCFICNPPPTPPPPETFWTPVGEPLWPDGSVALSVEPELQRGFAGQGADVRHLELTFEIARERIFGLPDAGRSARFLWEARRLDGGAIAGQGSTQRVLLDTFLEGHDGGFRDLLIARICPARDLAPVVDEPYEIQVWLAREADRQLYETVTLPVTPRCPGNTCPCR